MPLLFDELFTCPNCEVVFQSKVLGSYDTFGNRYSDLYIGSGDDPQPILHQVNKCPKCGFAALTIEMQNITINKEDILEAIKLTEEMVGRKAVDFTPGDCYLLIMNYQTYLTIEQKIFFLLQASYAYRELNDKEILQKTREKILALITELLDNNEFNDNPKELYQYLAGELNRLLGNNEQSMEFFKQVIENAPKDSLASRLTQFQLKNPSEIIPKEIFGR